MGSSVALTGPLRGLGWPPDAVAWAAVVLAVVVAGLHASHLDWSRLGKSRFILPALALMAALLSMGYLAYYLRGGARIIDATSYWLEARALADGAMSFDVPGPSGAFRGRFLLTAPGSERLSVLFPPGYPLLLSIGMRLGFPLMVGPMLAALLAWATFALSLRIWGRRDAAVAAAVLSVLCAALRYHTADTMSHAWSALLLTLAVLFSVEERRASAIWTGLAVGLLFATRPVTGVVGLLVVVVAIGKRRDPGWTVLAALGVIPGIVLLLCHQYAATGGMWNSSHLRYYALADGPPGCFRFGFGRGIGCLHEHGEFVARYLPQGHGPIEALLATGRRLRLHVMDVGNFEPIALLAPIAVVIGWSGAATRRAAIAVAAVLVCYAPFYFDGNYPGGGARLFADALPLEHALIAGTLVRWRLTLPVVCASLLGFAVHSSFEHRALAEREGGRPMFESRLLQAQGVTDGVVFVNTDHGFNLGHRPGATTGLVVARHSGDAHDTELLRALGMPPAYLYTYDARTGAASLTPFEPPPFPIFEAEAEWPPLEVHGGWAEPRHLAANCVSGGMGLALHPLSDSALSLTVEAYVSEPDRYRIVTMWAPLSQHRADGEALISLEGLRWRVPIAARKCSQHVGPTLELAKGRHRMVIVVSQGGWVFDSFELRRAVE